MAKIVYACVTYAILSLIYSAINVPYCAMPGALTLDPRERHSLQSWRFGLSFIGGAAGYCFILLLLLYDPGALLAAQ